MIILWFHERKKHFVPYKSLNNVLPSLKNVRDEVSSDNQFLIWKAHQNLTVTLPSCILIYFTWFFLLFYLICHFEILFQEHSIMVTVFSNTNSEPACLVSRLKFGNDNNVDNVQFQRLGWLIPQRGKKSILEKKKKCVSTVT